MRGEIWAVVITSDEQRLGSLTQIRYTVNESTMIVHERITMDPEICHGRPTIRGLRYPVETMLELMSSGMTIEEILNDYEDLERDDLLAVLAYAARLSRVKRVELNAA